MTIQKLALSGSSTVLNGVSPFNLTLNEQFDWSAGIMAGTGQTTVAADAALNLINTATAINLTRKLTNNGAANWTGTAGFTLNGVFQNNGNFTADFATPNSITGFVGSGTFNNAGVFTKLGTAAVTLAGPALNNSGIVDI